MAVSSLGEAAIFYFSPMLHKSLLWKIEKKDRYTCYLFGTMHVRDKVAFTQVEKVLNLMKSCTTFKSEIDLEQARESLRISDYQLPDGLRISDLIYQSRFDKWDRMMQKAFGLSLSPMDNMLPLIIINRLTESLLDDSNAYPLDVYLWHKAVEARLDRGGLETLEEQISTMRAMEIQEQIRMLKGIIRNVSGFKSSVKGLVEMYRDQDIAGLHKKSRKSLGPFKQTLLKDRNIKMSNRIASHENTPSIFAVGAAHLAGQEGMLNLLKKMDYTLKPM